MTRRPVTDLVQQARAALKRMLPLYQERGLGLGSDEWQELADTVLRALVYGPALDVPMMSLALPRGGYGLHASTGSPLVAQVREGGYLMVKTSDSRWAAADPSAMEGPSQVWECRSPIVSDSDAAAFEVVWGCGTIGGREEEVVVAVSDAEFFLDLAASNALSRGPLQLSCSPKAGPVGT